MCDSGGTVLFLELACGVDSVIQEASQEFGSSYLGIHAGLELPSNQRKVVKDVSERRSSGSSGSRKLVQVHISLPCTGGSPLLDLTKERQKTCTRCILQAS